MLQVGLETGDTNYASAHVCLHKFNQFKKLERKIKLFNQMVKVEVEFRCAGQQCVLAGTATENVLVNA